MLKRNGDIAMLDDKGRELEKYKVPYGATLKVTNGTKVRKGGGRWWSGTPLPACAAAAT